MQNFLEGMEAGYGKHKNPYHNAVHAADVLQTTFHILHHSGLMVTFSFYFKNFEHRLFQRYPQILPARF
jgi:hypothetical protein